MILLANVIRDIVEHKNQKQMFEQIWNDRKHVSEVSGRPLLPQGHPQWHWQFAHVLSKGAFPRYKLNPDNIMLMLPEEHERQEQFDAFQHKKTLLKRQYHDGKNNNHKPKF